MSTWTHCAGIIRVNAIRLNKNDILDFDSIVGKECLFDDDISVWEDMDEHPENYMPCGSEGSLHKSIWVNPDTDCLAAFTVSVFGDLRDYSDVDAIKTWFIGVCNKLFVREAVITIGCDINEDTIVYRYSKED